ncbi:uncharacterized protein LOC143282043 isoform X2 [Babylonia areolata]|uniref:uncharacterized protein LOC143282043 isoform X2 n=1 Tax=Babylonia areolata TaxID=304850 RepID=UPI003FD69BFA
MVLVLGASASAVAVGPRSCRVGGSNPAPGWWRWWWWVLVLGWGLGGGVGWGVCRADPPEGEGGGEGGGQQHFTDLWAVQIEGGQDVARQVAARHGFLFRGQIMPDYYHFQHRKVSKRSTFPSSYYNRYLAKDPKVKWLEQQVAKKRVKRDIEFNDPKWPIMWYLNRGGGLDMNVKEAWEMGYTGKGVVVTILDDGIEKDHPDLKINYDEQASYDVNGHDPDPQPRYDFSNENRHGTRCAGEVAAQADNFVCSVGVAYNARIGGVRMLDGDVTDSVEAQSLSLNTQHIHIYSASWGPDDDGRTVDGPATLARKAFYDGITKGRGGLGSIFVWASGNGGRDEDNCNCDGYTNSIFTLSISSCTEKGNVPWYSESCSSTLATTYSSGSGAEKQIVTTDLRDACTENHTGTSASAPLAAGLIALALEANPFVTWRDMQHIVVETAKPDNLHAQDWVINGAGKKVSHSFGFGLMDASAMVAVARNWTTVPEQHICEIRSQDQNRLVPMNGKLIVPLYTDGCEGSVNEVRYVEHVQARLTMTSSRRGEIQVSLTSPSQTRSVLLAKRKHDVSREGFNNWAFMTTHNWGEAARGEWKLEIENGASSELKEWTLVVMGTKHHPRKQTSSSQSATAKHSFRCAGVTSNGICIECKRGYYKLGQHCVSQCPNHYYGSVHTVPLYSSLRRHSADPKPHTQGLCQPCHQSCLTCRGQAPSDCYQCAPGYQRQGEGGVACHKTLLWDLLDPAVMKHLAWALILCIGAVIFLSILLAVWQARQRRRLCWSDKRHPPAADWGKGVYDGVSTRGECAGDGPLSTSTSSANNTRRDVKEGGGTGGGDVTTEVPPRPRGKRGYSKVTSRGDPMVLSEFASHRPEEADDELSSFSSPSVPGDSIHPLSRRSKRGYSKVSTRGEHIIFTDFPGTHRPEEEADDELSSFGKPSAPGGGGGCGGDVACRRSKKGYSELSSRNDVTPFPDFRLHAAPGPDTEFSTFRDPHPQPPAEDAAPRHSKAGRELSCGGDPVGGGGEGPCHRTKGGYSALPTHGDLTSSHPDGPALRARDDNGADLSALGDVPTRKTKGGHPELFSLVTPSAPPGHGPTRRTKRRHSEMSAFTDPVVPADIPSRRAKGELSEVSALYDNVFLDDLPPAPPPRSDSYIEGCSGRDLPQLCPDPAPSRRAWGSYSEVKAQDLPADPPDSPAPHLHKDGHHDRSADSDLPVCSEIPSWHTHSEETCAVYTRKDPFIFTDFLANRLKGRSLWSGLTLKGDPSQHQTNDEHGEATVGGDPLTSSELHSFRPKGTGFNEVSAWSDFPFPYDGLSRARTKGDYTAVPSFTDTGDGFSRRGKRDSGEGSFFRDSQQPGDPAPHRTRAGHHRSCSTGGGDPTTTGLSTTSTTAMSASGHRPRSGARRERHSADTPLLTSIPASLRAGKVHLRAAKSHVHAGKGHAHRPKPHARSAKTHGHHHAGKGQMCGEDRGQGAAGKGGSHGGHGRSGDVAHCCQEEDSIWHVPVA